jgi:hypothetical protein
LLGLSDKLHAMLTHLDPSSTDPRKVRVQLTLTDKS